MTSLELQAGRTVRLSDRYELEAGPVLLTGVQALARLVLDQLRADRLASRAVAAILSGYPGSPLGGFDLEVQRNRALCEHLGIVIRPGLNEELAATAVWGSQLIQTMPNPQVDGVLGVWYGKAPGVDRAGDALRHGNLVGADPNGGMIALCGDDPTCKSSSVPSASEQTLAALGMPVIYPGSPQEALDLGRHAVALSRASGLWAALKIVTNVADTVASVEVGHPFEPLTPIVEFEGRPYVHVPEGMIVAPHSNRMEVTLRGPRLELARAYARVNGLNQIVLEPTRPRLGIVTAGTTYYDLREAFASLGIDDGDLHNLGVRILKLGMLWPLEPTIVAEFANGLEEILVLEDKGPFLEIAVRDALYGTSSAPRVIGKTDESGGALLPVAGALDVETLARVVGARILRFQKSEAIAAGLQRLNEAKVSRSPALQLLRTPFFCSGCPHNRSTDAPDDSLVGTGIGCHAMARMSPSGKGSITGNTQMGSEGAQWIGQAPFVDASHFFQNMGDGTFSHSGSLAIRAAVAADVNMTYKLLVNSAVAMTGGQNIEGGLDVGNLTRLLEAEGVRRIIVTAEDISRYRGVKLARIAELRSRSDLMEAQLELREVPGVTVLIHDQWCAAELRRLRKRGKAVDPARRIFINERVCEGCGDCGRKSHCLSVAPIDTEFGPKTRIDQASCNKDYSCVEGDCPSFLSVIPGKKAKHVAPSPPTDLPQPELLVDSGDTLLRLIGIGGTGVTTTGQVIAMAALLDGKSSLGLDQTGLAQKGGPVISDVHIFAGRQPPARSSRASRLAVDGYLSFDLLGAVTPSNLETAEPGRTVAVVSTSRVPTGQMIGDPNARFDEIGDAIEAVDERTRPDENVYFDALALAEAVFRDGIFGNSLVVGAAWQRGLIPLSVAAIEEAFRLNGTAADVNISAFHWGRAVIARPDAVADVMKADEAPQATADIRAVVDSVGAAPGSELERLLESRVADLVDYQSLRYARRYAEYVAGIVEAERAVDAEGDAVSTEVARHLHRLMAYKDEYEVARLHLDPAERRRITAEFGPDAKISYMLHPPLLRALGLKHKLALGPWFNPAFRVLRALRRVRGTPLDVFGYAKVRRVERALPTEYRAMVDEAIVHLEDAPDEVLALCGLPDVIRGYEHVKLANVELFNARAREGLERIVSRKTEVESAPEVAG